MTMLHEFRCLRAWCLLKAGAGDDSLDSFHPRAGHIDIISNIAQFDFSRQVSMVDELRKSLLGNHIDPCAHDRQSAPARNYDV